MFWNAFIGGFSPITEGLMQKDKLNILVRIFLTQFSVVQLEDLIYA